MSRVVVVGTLNMDLVVRVERLPDLGETVLGTTLIERPGGKGANQAMAAASLVPTSLIGAVGDDDTGRRMLDAARAGGVDVRHVVTVDEVSGRAIIEVDAAADNRIVVVSGANSLLTPEAVRAALDEAEPSIVLTQLESPMAVTDSIAQWAHDCGCRFVLNPSPVAALPESVLAAADPVVVNEIQAAYFTQCSAQQVSADPEAVARDLCSLSKSVVITLGAAGVVVADSVRTSTVEVDRVPVSDTTGAGDHFAGVLAAGLAVGTGLHTAARDAAHAATAFLAGRSTG